MLIAATHIQYLRYVANLEPDVVAVKELVINSTEKI